MSSSLCRKLFLLAYSLCFFSISVVAFELTDSQIDAVSLRLTESAKLSWEIGTRAQTILERNATRYSVFSDQSLPPPTTPDADTLAALRPFFDIANAIVSSQSKDATAGPRPLMPDGSAADPASIGVCVLIANWTREANGGASMGLDYAAAAKAQIDYLFSAVPRTSDGALSHRSDQLQLWSDFVYMVPPFLAYYGAMTRNRSMINEGYNQIKLYRNYLRDPHQSMWKHVLLGTSGNDPGCWSTGNGWAAAGILRVYATIKRSEYAPTFRHQLRDLGNWVQEIHRGIYSHLDTTSIFANYADKPVDSSGNFYDSASTALLASTVYRAAQILGQRTYLSYAERSRQALSAFNTSNSNSNYTSTTPQNDGSLSSFSSSYVHFTSDGVLQPVVNPHSYGEKGATVSAEAQAFVVQMHQSWKDWQNVSQSGAQPGDKCSIYLVPFIVLVFML